MIKLPDGRYIIGFDNGYQLSKTTNYVFDNGVHSLGDVEPSLLENSLFYADNWYKVGEGRAAITTDKVSDENARLLTMAGIAKELKRAGLISADIVLAVGLPFSDYGRMKKKLIEYYNKLPELEFMYEGIEYYVSISKVYCFPQCYSAVASRLGNMAGDYIVIDVGSKTTDVVSILDGVPMESQSITIERAMIKWIRDIQGTLQVQLGESIDESDILKVALNKSCYLSTSCVSLIRTELKREVHDLELELAERGFDLKHKKVIFAGGGSVVIKNFAEGFSANVLYETDINANAKGYEYLAHELVIRTGL